MKCPHCGIEVRDTTTVCGYCGGKIPQRKGTHAAPAGKDMDLPPRSPPKGATGKKKSEQEDDEGEEEVGGLSACLQPGEQVLIGSLNVSVKRFLFHAYLSDRRIFLIDTQEKKLKVTAKDIPLDTITGSSVEFSENSDPVLVLSIRSSDDDVKTMKLVFAGNGMDRSAEVDEWVELLNEQVQPKKQKKTESRKPAREERRDEPVEEPEPEEVMVTPSPKPDLRPAKRPVKDHERQPPVKRLLSLYKTGPEEEAEKPPVSTRRPTPVQHDEEVPERTTVRQPYRDIMPERPAAEKTVRKVEIQSAVKTALKTPAPPAGKPAEKHVHTTQAGTKRTVQPIPAAREPVPEEPVIPMGDETADDEVAPGPIFCQNCGKKLPAAANFCPGCGNRISSHKEKQKPRAQEREAHTPDSTGSQRGEAGSSRSGKTPVKKGPKGSEMTILHKFLRR